MICNLASTKQKFVSFLSFGLIESVEETFERRRPGSINHLNYFYALPLFLKNEEEADLNGLNYFVLKNLFPNLKVTTKEELQDFIRCLNQNLTGSVQFLNVYKYALILFIMKNKQEFLPDDLIKVILNVIFDLNELDPEVKTHRSISGVNSI
ncbi:MAG: hypothetical protein H0U57_02895 [Tatlockia sp.]|nr:hypothetical protein [Tatlockia sp.]